MTYDFIEAEGIKAFTEKLNHKRGWVLVEVFRTHKKPCKSLDGYWVFTGIIEKHEKQCNCSSSESCQ